MWRWVWGSRSAEVFVFPYVVGEGGYVASGRIRVGVVDACQKVPGVVGSATEISVSFDEVGVALDQSFVEGDHVG